MTSKSHGLIIAVLLVIIAGLLYKFIVAGDTRPAPDGRIAIELAPAERAQVLAEMRDYVLAVQQIVQGLAKGDAKQIEAAALPVGTRAMKRMRLETMAKLPYEYKQAGFGMHRDFDTIAIMAHQGKDIRAIQLQLADSMNRCINCHASYQLPSPHPAK
ncbi:MAG TPA: hypothetical protein VNH42_02655 [Mariprofundaceae bacterium]|nr:hypothetical protein [Mariprofundaceae bacterium]